MSNFLALQAPIMARLRAALDAAGLLTVPVLGQPDITSVDGTLPAPAVVVSFEGYSVNDTSAQSRRVTITQMWDATVITRHTAAIGPGTAAIAQSGTITDIVMTSLMGWHPPDSAGPLQLISPDQPSIERGYHYLPIRVEAKLYRAATP